MSYLLKIDVSPQGENSSSRQLGAHFVEAFTAAHPDVEVRVKDISEHSIPHLDGETLTAGYVPEENRPEGMQAKFQRRQDIITELVEAKSVVITTPMWNWSTPSVLKAYIDQIVMPGVLDPYTNKKLAGKKITVLIACGSSYGPDSHHPEWDYESGYLKFIFGSLGCEDVQVIRTEFCLAGILPGMESLIEKKEQSMTHSKEAAAARAKEDL
jgi:FMN-dependent NADH-azoreductase